MTVVQTSSDKCVCFWGVFGISENRDLDLCVVHEAFEITHDIYNINPHGDRMKNHKNILGPNIIDNVTRGPEYSESDVTWTNAKQPKIYHNIVDMIASCYKRFIRLKNT